MIMISVRHSFQSKVKTKSPETGHLSDGPDELAPLVKSQQHVDNTNLFPHGSRVNKGYEMYSDYTDHDVSIILP